MQNKLLLLFFTVVPFFLFAQNFTQSNLPILVIDTENAGIPDEPKITAHLGIIDNGAGAVNRLSDPFNDYDGRIGIELRGQTSQFFPKKPYGIETRNADGSNNNVSLLGLPAENDWVLHNPYSDKSLLRNALAYKLAEQIMPYAPRTRMVELVLNEEYRGVYLFTEKIKRDKNRVDIATLLPADTEGDELTGGYIFKIDKAREGEEGVTSNYPPPAADDEQFIRFYYQTPDTEAIRPEQIDYLTDFLHTAEDALAEDDFADAENGYRRYWDTETFIDYLIINELARNVDGYRISTYLYKDKDSNDPRLKIGPVWDYNLGFGNANYCNGGEVTDWAFDFNNLCPGDFWLVPFWWQRFTEDKQFTEDLNNRWSELRSGVFSDERMMFMCDSLAGHIEEAAGRNYQRYPEALGEYVWPNNFVGETWRQEVDYLCGWLTDRVAWLDVNIPKLNENEYVPSEFFAPRVTPTLAADFAEAEFYVNAGTKVTLRLFDGRGREVNNSTVIAAQNGVNTAQFDLRNLQRGVYFYLIDIPFRQEIYGGKVVKM